MKRMWLIESPINATKWPYGEIMISTAVSKVKNQILTF